MFNFMRKKTKKLPVYDYEDVVKRISERTGLCEEAVKEVIYEEEVYMVELGIMSTTGIDKMM